MEWKLVFLPSRNTVGPSIQDNVGGGVIVQKNSLLALQTTHPDSISGTPYGSWTLPVYSYYPSTPSKVSITHSHYSSAHLVCLFFLPLPTHLITSVLSQSSRFVLIRSYSILLLCFFIHHITVRSSSIHPSPLGESLFSPLAPSMLHQNFHLFSLLSSISSRIYTINSLLSWTLGLLICLGIVNSAARNIGMHEYLELLLCILGLKKRKCTYFLE